MDEADSHFYLNSADVERLMRDHSPHARLAVLSKVSTHYREQDFSPHELAIAEQIFRLMMRDVELEVRRQLAEHAKDMPHMPRDIILHLAQDTEEVAVPVIQMSQVLSDADLVYLVQTSREVGKLHAVTQRERLSERVADALVETRYPDVVQSLVQNPAAKLSHKTLENIVQDFAREGGVIAALAARDSLPAPLVEKLVALTAQQAAQAAQTRYGLEEESARTLAHKTQESTTLALIGSETPDEAEALALQMHQEERLTSSFLFTALARGQALFFACALGVLANVPRANALRLVADRGPYGYPAIYAKSGLPESMREASRLLLLHVHDLQEQHVPPGTRAYANTLAKAILDDPQAQGVENMAYMLALVRQQIR